MNCDRFARRRRRRIISWGVALSWRPSNPPNKNVRVVEVTVNIGEYRQQSYKNVLE